MPKFFSVISVALCAALATGGCSAVLPLNEALTPVNTRSPTPENVSQTSVQGRVQSVQDNKILILSPENDEITLHIADSSNIWDGIGWVAEIPIEIGDDAVATGFWDKNGSIFIVQNLYINIVYLKGSVERVNKEKLQFELDDLRQEKNTILVSASTDISLTTNKQRGNFQEIQMLPDVGNYVEVVGRRLHNGIILAVYITIY